MQPAPQPLNAPPRSPAAIEPKVEGELTRLLYRSAGFGLFSNFVLAAVLVAGLWTYFPIRTLVLWLLAVIAISVLRLALNVSFAKRPRTDAELPRWRNVFLSAFS